LASRLDDFLGPCLSADHFRTRALTDSDDLVCLQITAKGVGRSELDTFDSGVHNRLRTVIVKATQSSVCERTDQQLNGTLAYQSAFVGPWFGAKSGGSKADQKEGDN
jgi:hypothetical protein